MPSAVGTLVTLEHIVLIVCRLCPRIITVYVWRRRRPQSDLFMQKQRKIYRLAITCVAVVRLANLINIYYVNCARSTDRGNTAKTQRSNDKSTQRQ